MPDEATLPPVPEAQVFAAPQAWRAIDFISDLHLAADTPRGFEAWESYLDGTDADAVFILGDLFELWVGDDARTGAFEQRCVEVLARSAARRFTAFMAGNRDFLVGDEMLAACGMTALPDPTLLLAFDRRTLLSHGDALCLADVDYQRFRQQVRNPVFQRPFLAQPLAQRLALARQMRHKSEERKEGQSMGDWADLDPPATLAWMAEAEAPVLVHGHTHRPDTELLAPGRTRYVLTDWDLDSTGRPPRAEVLRLTAGGFERLAPAETRPSAAAAGNA